MGPRTEYRAAVAEALSGRSVAGSATSGGLPRDAIRNVLKGHDPKLTRADAICRALGITFTIGTPGSSTPAVPHPPGPHRPASSTPGPVDNARLEHLLDRLADLWDSCDANERRHLAAGITAILDLVAVVRPPAPENVPHEQD